MTRNRTDLPTRLTLAVDAGSPVVSVALAREGSVIAETHRPSGRASGGLLQMIDTLLSEVGAEVSQLGGIVALRGPGSFTGLRVGLATCLGLHQALGIPATTVTTFETLASLSPERELTVLAVVESIRQSWLGQSFRAGEIPEPISEPRLLTDDELAAEDADLLIGFGLTDHPRRPTRGRKRSLQDAPPLASRALLLHGRKLRDRWDPSGLVRPLYLQAVSATPPIVAAR